MDGKIYLFGQQPGVQFLGPQRLAANFSQRTILYPVAAGGHGDEFNHRFGPAMRSAKARAGLFGLRHGERGTAGAELERLCWQ